MAGHGAFRQSDGDCMVSPAEARPHRNSNQGFFEAAGGETPNLPIV